MNPKDASKIRKLSKFSFHGTIIEKEPLLKNVSDTYWPKYNNFLTSIITKSNDVLQMNKNSENSLGNLYCDIMRRSTGADISILNSGAFRNTWNPGQISLANIFGMSPFETRIVTVEMTGAELLKMLEQTEGGKYGFYPTSGLRLLVTLEPKKKLYYAKLFDGLYEYPIENNKTYVVATTGSSAETGVELIASVKNSGGTDITWYEFPLKKNSASAESVYQVGDGGSVFCQTTLAMTFNKQDAVKRMAIQSLALNELYAIYEDANGNRWFLGKDNPVTLSEGGGATGQQKTDLNSYNVSLVDDSMELPLMVDADFKFKPE
jgi:hypothetical protein